jgi:malic enzyme
MSPHRATCLTGSSILRDPTRNKDTAFTKKERQELGLEGLLPPTVLSLGQQVTLELEHVSSKQSDLEQYIGLISLLDRNETLFYRLVVENLPRFNPIIYTPTVGTACQYFSHIYRRPRGLYLTPDDRGHIEDRLHNIHRDIRLIVVTDNARILGLGDLGAGGMAIPIGKLVLYTVGAGIHPSLCLPVSLDVGTDNESLLSDVYYMGYRKKRLRGAEYESFVHEFVEAVAKVFPKALLQWEDFKKETAFNFLEKYADRLPSFNDDIQGTSAVAVAGILSGLRIIGQKLGQQRILNVGSGAAGIGIGRLIRTALKEEGLSKQQTRLAQLFIDTTGVLSDRPKMDAHKKEFAWTNEELSSIGLRAPFPTDLRKIVEAYRPTILIGTTGQQGAFNSEIIRTMANFCNRPMIFPFSNPTTNSECTPTQAILYSDGKALVATGSPFSPVEFNGTTHVIGQANNVFIFPGVGLGILASGARRVTESMFLAAAKQLTAMTDERHLATHSLYPNIRDLRKISREIAFKVACVARDEKNGLNATDDEFRSIIDRSFWYPDYPDPLGDDPSKYVWDRDRKKKSK